MSIKTDAQVIRNETVAGANTATRVGTNLVAIADDLLAKQTAIDLNTTDITTLQGEQTTQDAAIALNTAKRSYPSADETKLAGISAGAEVNPDVVSQLEAESGTATTERIWTAQRVKQAIDALGGGGGASVDDTAYAVSWDGVTSVAPSKNAIYDKIESVIAGVGTGATPEKFTAVGGETNWVLTNPIVSSHKMFVNGVKLVEGTDYTQTGSTITFTGYTSVAGHEWEYYPDIAVPTTYNAIETSIADAGGLITATNVEDALQENRTAINLNTAKVGVTTELKPTDIDTLAELNAIVTDATLIDTNDARLSDARTPTAHTHTKAEITDFVESDYATSAEGDLASTAVQPAAIADFETTTELNARDTANRARANHTGTQLAATISDFNTTVQGLSINNLSEDTTPQLGGELNFNGHSVGGDAQTATGDGATTINWTLGNFFHFQFGAFNETFTFTAPTKAATFILKLVQDSVGSRTATWPATVKWSGGVAPTLTTATTGTDIITFYFDGTNYFAVEVLDFS